MKKVDIRRCRYLVDGECICEEPMKFSRMHAVGEDIVMYSKYYIVKPSSLTEQSRSSI